MLKISVQLKSEHSASLIENFLTENELGKWTIEKDFESGQSKLCGYVEISNQWQEELNEIKKNCHELGEVVQEKLIQKNWSEEYKKFINPWQCENLFWIPTHLKDKVSISDGDIAVYIDPGMAFGTGAHETTRLCGRTLILIKGLYEKTGDLIIKDCLDIGCGSGILGISALKLGFFHATMIDIDPDAMRICKQNAQLNDIFSNQITFVTGDININLLGRQADVVLANILSDVLIKNANLLINSVKPGGSLCLSGILRSEKSTVATIFDNLSKKSWESVVSNSMDDGQWSVLVYFRL